MSNTWLLIDCPFICHRTFHTTGHLNNGVVFGFLRDLTYLQEQFKTRKVAFCWDCVTTKNLRKDIYPEYKGNRPAPASQEERDARSSLHNQMMWLRGSLLSEMGYRNVFAKVGYEADDLIASLCFKSVPPEDKAIIVSSDHDLYQLLSDDVSMWNPASKRMVTFDSFVEEYSIAPPMWANVKALAGCPSDNIKGIQGVGEKTAVKFINHQMKNDSKIRVKIGLVYYDTIEMNLPLVRLPFMGCPVLTLKEDTVTDHSWNEQVEKLDMPSLMRVPHPFERQKKRRVKNV